jgi:hypothetical protein
MKLYLIALLLVISSGTFAQTLAPEILTNAKIISMVKGGLPKAVILKSIETKTGNFDTSTDGLLALKKQGVTDEIITAIMGKATKPEPPKAVPVVPAVAAVPFNAVNTKDCKFDKVETQNGTKLPVIKVGGKLGNMRLGKEGNKYVLVYETKFTLGMIATDTKNLASLRVDSVQFLFADNTVISLKPFLATAHLKNENSELQPHITDLHYSLILEPGSKAETLFRNTKLKVFRVIAERNAQYGDLFNDKQQEQLLKAFVCFQ